MTGEPSEPVEPKKIDVCELEEVGAMAIVHLGEEIDSYESPLLKALMLELMAKDYKEIIIDFDQTIYISGSVLGILVNSLMKTVSRGKMGLTLSNVHDRRISKVFEITQLDRAFIIEEGLDLENRPDWEHILIGHKARRVFKGIAELASNIDSGEIALSE